MMIQATISCHWKCPMLHHTIVKVWIAMAFKEYKSIKCQWLNDMLCIQDMETTVLPNWSSTPVVTFNKHRVGLKGMQLTLNSTMCACLHLSFVNPLHIHHHICHLDEIAC